MSTSQENLVGAYEAKAKFSALLSRVIAGEEITITRHGTPVARLVPVRSASTDASRRAAVIAMRQLAAGQRLDGLKIKDLIAEGRR